MVWKRLALIPFLIFTFSFTSVSYAYDDEYYDDLGDEYYESQADVDHYTEPRNSQHYSYVQNEGRDYGDVYDDDGDGYYAPPPRKSKKSTEHSSSKYSSRLPQQIPAPGEKVIVINPRVHAWGAYDASGNLVRAGVATSGANYCADVKRRCRTSVGSFRIYSLGSAHCKSSKYPLGKGGAPMPYCMYFNKNQALHGSNQVADANLSHGCVRLRVSDAEWLRFNFATIGTRVVIKPY